MNKIEYKLLGSAPTLDRILLIIKKYFYSEKILKETFDKNIFDIINRDNSKLNNFRVFKKGNRFRFECTNNGNITCNGRLD
jgi:hypothetical protein